MKIHEAVISGDFESIKELVKNGADINEIDADNRTLLHKIVMNKGHFYVLYRRFPYPKSFCSIHNLAILERLTLEIVQYLLVKGTDYKVKDANGMTALDLAEKYGMSHVVACLKLEKNGLPAYLNQLKNTPDAIDKSSQEKGVALPTVINRMIIDFAFFEPSKNIYKKLDQHQEQTISCSCNIL